MTPLNSPALPAIANSPPATAGAGKPAPEAAEGRDFASALERSRRSAAEDDASPAAVGDAANPRTGKASGTKRGAQDEATLQAPLVEVLLAAAPVTPPQPPSGASAPAADTALAAARQPAEAGAAAVGPAQAATLPAAAAAAAAEDAASQFASAGSAGAHLPHLPELQPASGADALAAAETQGPVPARKVARDAAPIVGATASATASAMQQSGTRQLVGDPTVTAYAVDAVAPRPEAKPHGAADHMANLGTEPVRDARTASTTTAMSAAAVAAAANSGNTQSPSSAAAPRPRDPTAHDDLPSPSPLPPAGVAAPNATGASASTAAPGAGAIAPLVGSDAWGAALGHQVVRLGQGGGQVAELNLNPAHLGPLKITLSVNDNQAQVAFVSAHASVRDAVEAALPQLRASFAETGISLGQTSVGAESRQGAQRDEPRTPDRDGRSAAAVDGASANTAFAEPSLAAAPRALRMPGLGVDTFA